MFHEYRIILITVFVLIFKEDDAFLFGHNISGKLLNVITKVLNKTLEPTENATPINTGTVPDYFDWRDQSMVSPVKDQRNCAACWAFTAVANIESHLKIHLQRNELLSEQFLIDCDDENKGCGDASIIQTFVNIVTKFGGVLRDRDYYPYANRRLQCRWSQLDKKISKSGQSISQASPVPVIGFRRVFPDEQIMAEFVYKYGPLSTAINSASMARYEGGIDEPTDLNCDPKMLNHAVLIVGYNTYISNTTGQRVPYWIIKNSWGEEWGDKGFYYLVRGRNACGVASDVSFAIVN